MCMLQPVTRGQRMTPRSTERFLLFAFCVQVSITFLSYDLHHALFSSVLVVRRWRCGRIFRLKASHCCACCHLGIEFSLALNKVSNYKHQSWYVHYLIWIIPQQIFEYGNLWRYSTAAIESRGAQLKKIGRRTVCWRPLDAA
eukprot:60082-Pleurochrysis_carterae.AAC.1